MSSDDGILIDHLRFWEPFCMDWLREGDVKLTPCIVVFKWRRQWSILLFKHLNDPVIVGRRNTGSCVHNRPIQMTLSTSFISSAVFSKLLSILSDCLFAWKCFHVCILEIRIKLWNFLFLIWSGESFFETYVNK